MLGNVMNEKCFSTSEMRESFKNIFTSEAEVQDHSPGTKRSPSSSVILIIIIAN